MPTAPPRDIHFERLTTIPFDWLVTHMSDPRMARHMPLLSGPWASDDAAEFVAEKEASWHRDGLGHRAILIGDHYADWGGFQKDGDGWDFGLVLAPDAFGQGGRILRKALAFTASDDRIPTVTFLLPASRKHLRALARIGATSLGELLYDGAVFRKYRLDIARGTPG